MQLQSLKSVLTLVAQVHLPQRLTKLPEQLKISSLLRSLIYKNFKNVFLNCNVFIAILAHYGLRTDTRFSVKKDQLRSTSIKTKLRVITLLREPTH